MRRVPSRADSHSARLVLNGDNMLGLCNPSNLLLVLSAEDRRALLKLLSGGLVFISKVGEKLQMELCLCFEIFEFCICFINILQLQEALFHWTRSFGSSGGSTTDPIYWLEVLHMQ